MANKKDVKQQKSRQKIAAAKGAKQQKVYILLDTKTKTYNEFNTKDELSEELKKIVDKGVEAGQLKIVRGQMLSYELEYQITIRERLPKKKS